MPNPRAPKPLTLEQVKNDLQSSRKSPTGGAAFGITPMIGKRREDRQDREAAKSFPVDLARGVAAGFLGMPGDFESLARLPYELISGNESPTFMPTSEDMLKRMPFGTDTPAGQFASGLGSIAGGSANVGSVIRGVKAAPGALKTAARNLSTPSTLNPQAGVIKMKGGNWMGRNVEGALKPLKRNTAAGNDPTEMLNRMRERYTPEEIAKLPEGVMKQHVLNSFAELERDVALNNWADRNLTNYVKKEMATPEDPVRRLAEEGITHFPIAEDPTFWARRGESSRKEAGGNQMATSDLAKQWENRSDAAINAETAQQHQDMMHLAPGMYTSAEDWIKKLPPETQLFNTRGSNFNPSDLGFDHIMDVLREDVNAGRIRPEQLNKVSMEQAVRRTYEYDQELAKKMADAKATAREGLPVYKEYPEGYRWVELNKPGAFASESEAMGHSVRGYEPPQGHPDWTEGSGGAGSLGYGHGGWEAIKSGKAKVYSLVDSKGEPHVTVESRAPDARTNYEEMRAIESQADQEADARGFTSFAERDRFTESRVRELKSQLMAQKQPEGDYKITQIKGKGNAAPKEDYLPYVQDFVRSGQWADVGDLGNTGLYKADPGELGMFIPSDPRLKNLPGRRTEDFEKAKEAGLFGDQKYFTRNEWEDILRRQIESESGPLPPLEEGMARGGRVQFSDNPDVMALELAGGGAVRMQSGGPAGLLGRGIKAASKALKGTQDVLPAAEREANKAKFLEGSKTPMRLYHGTTATEGGKRQEAIRRIKPSKEGALGSGVYLTPNSAHASGYSGIPNDEAIAAMAGDPYAKRMADQFMADRASGTLREGQEGGNMLPVTARLRNPLIIEGKGDPMVEALTKLGMDEDSASKMVERAYEQKGYIGKQVQQRAQAAGYDGLMQYRDGDLSEVVSYNPNAVKSDIGNRGTYDINDPDLNKAKGGAIRMQAGGLPKRLIESGAKALKALKPAKEEVKPNLVIKNKPGLIVSDLIDEDPEIAKRLGAEARAKRQAAIEAEGKRKEAAKQTQPSVGYRKSTPQNPDPLVGTRFINEAPFGLNPNEPFDLSKYKGGSGLVLPWDSQSRNVRTTQVSGLDLPNQIFRQTHGGVPYSFDTQHAAKGVVGASGEDIAKRVKTRSDLAVKENIGRGGSGELLHFPITMGYRGEDYALPYSEFSFDIINYKLMTGELTQKQADQLTNMVRNFEPPKYKGKKPFADFAGFTSPEGLDQIYTGQGLKVPSGELRKAIADRIIWQKGSQEKLGFNAEDLMNATTYEPLRGVDKGFIGSSVMRNTPSGMRLSPSAGKYPYDTDFSGEHLGRLEDNVDVEALFYRTLNPIKRELMDRETKKPYTRESLRNAAIGAIEKRNERVSQPIDQQFLDDYDTYITELKKPTEYRKGGAVRKYAAGGAITADDLILEERML